MDPLLMGSILTASLLGSLHCTGMCGGLVAFYAGGGTTPAGLSLHLHLAYNLGRLATYTVVGAVAGLLGAGLNLAGEMVRWQHLAALVGGGLMIVWGALTLLRLAGVRATIPNPLVPLSARARPLYRQLHARPGVISAFGVGSLSGLLPCGWLYLFVGMAASTGRASSGASAMALFWLGTLPAMAAMGILLRGALGPVRRYLPVATAFFLLAAGLFTVGSKWNHSQRTRERFEQGAAGSMSGGCPMHEAQHP